MGLDLSFGMATSVLYPCIAVGDVQDLPFSDDAFDAAAALMMLYHVPN